jgi:hypothetical protein
MKSVLILFSVVSVFFATSLQQKNVAKACPVLVITNMQSQYCYLRSGQQCFCINSEGGGSGNCYSCFDGIVTYTATNTSTNQVYTFYSAVSGGCGCINLPVGNYTIKASVCNFESQTYNFSVVLC